MLALQKMRDKMSNELFLGIDIGSTTVKYVLCNKEFNIVAKEYKEHNTKQAHTLLNMLQNLSKKIDFSNIKHSFITGSGATKIAPLINAKFIQEVNAVVLSIEHLHPDVHSCIELGGQDAKVIHFNTADDGTKSVFTSMNDKCASGTGATIEKCSLKVGLSKDELHNLKFKSDKLHFVAAKCGVFAETDIVNLLKASIPKDEIMNSLANAIVMQNLTVLTRGITLKPKVILLGGPNKYLPFLQEAWRLRIKELWDERGVQYDEKSLDEQIFTPQNAEFYAALGAVIFGLKEKQGLDFIGIEKLNKYANQGSINNLERSDTPLVESQEELDAFLKKYQIPTFSPAKLSSKTSCYLGVDGGSTSSKAVLIDDDGKLLFKAYRLSQGNPIEDFVYLLKQIKDYDKDNLLDIRGFGVTGYAGDVLQKALSADANIIETIAHLKSAIHYFGDSIDVLCDIGGQDIKVLFVQNGMLKNFRLSNQCSAGNGALLQAMAKQFNVPLTEFADIAFDAKKAPAFNYGCAVFLDTDRVNFQKEGYTQAELFAGIAKVLPKNVWQYVVGESHLSTLGRHFVLQGGTQYNKAALKAQVDYIKEQVADARISVHPYPGEAGAIGAAIEAKNIVAKNGFSSFVGINEALQIQYTTKTDNTTKCDFCPMNCNRTFIDTKLPSSKMIRYIAGFKCDKGTLENREQLKKMQKEQSQRAKVTPNLVAIEAKELFNFASTPSSLPSKETIITKTFSTPTLKGWGPTITRVKKVPFQRSSKEDLEYRKNLTIAMPRVLNIYSKAPFFRAYLNTLGIENIIFSPKTSEKLYLEGAKYGSIDPCFPAKVANSHIYYFLFKKSNIDFLWFPTINEIDGYLSHTMANTACPIVSGTPEVTYATFTKERDLFKEKNIDFLRDTTTFTDTNLLKKQLFNAWGDRLKITEDESNFAVQEALKAQKKYENHIQNIGKKVILDAIENKEIIILLISRPYHSDEGLNHGILKEFQALGYKVLSMNSIPKDEEFLKPFFKEDLEKGLIEDVFDIRDVWQENYSTNSAQKVWSAKFASRVPNIAVVDISSFKCGHDAPTYAIIDKILQTSRTPHLMLHDLDANKPSGTIKIRIKTFVYALEEYKNSLF